MKRIGVRAMLVCWIAVGAVIPALAVDGVIEINQPKALAGSITAGDNPGFPVFITQPGSYRLTSDLDPPDDVDGINIMSPNVTLDLNGFSIFGGGEMGSSDGIVFSDANIEIRNGTVRGFLHHGIFGASVNSRNTRVIDVRVFDSTLVGMLLEGETSLVDRCTASGNGTWGISATGDASLVTDSVMEGNGDEGLRIGSLAGYRTCTMVNNNGGNLNPQVLGTGSQLGPNVCGTDTICP